MKKIVEFYPRRQGRPEGRELIDLETGMTQELSNYLALKEEYEQVKVILKELLGEQISKLTELIIEAKQAKLHLASMSDEPIDEDDIDVE